MTDETPLTFGPTILEEVARRTGWEPNALAEYLRDPKGWTAKRQLQFVARLPVAQQVIADAEAGRLPAESAPTQVRAARYVQRLARRAIKDIDPAELDAFCTQCDADADDGPRLIELVAQLRNDLR